ncbi:MAG: hypothetical protein GY755_22445 [Chloroflexi bacterium]|nr:hypothetical protein [Chloroflexota bacterium]
MAPLQKKQPRRRKRISFTQSILTFFLTVTSIATDGFGIVEESQLSHDFRTLISESFPADFIEPFNRYLEELGLTTIPANTNSDVEKAATPEEDAPSLAALLAEEMVEAMLTAEGLATPQLPDARQTSTAQPSPTPSVIPSSTPTSPATFTPSPIPTNTFVWYPWTSTPKPPSNQNPTCAGFNHSNPQSTGIITIDLSSLCSDPDGDSWTLTSTTQGAEGSTTFTTPNIFYDPNDGFAGTDNLTFTISDGKGGTHTQAFDVIISNLPPITTVDSGTVFENSTVNTFNVLANDSDPGNDSFTITNKTNGSNGTTEVPPGNTSIRYRPAANFTGTDSFTYTVTDTHGGSTTGTVNVVVFPNVIILYRAGSYTGDLGDRNATDALCSNSLPAGFTKRKALISYSLIDDIANMPATHSFSSSIVIQASGGMGIANNWADLLDGNIASTLSTAGITPNVAWWSGSNTNGSFNPTWNCAGWTSNLNTDGGITGNATLTDFNWINNNNSACNQALDLLCVAYP